MSTVAIVCIIILVVLIIFGISLSVTYANKLKVCETNQSPYCYSIVCPGSTGGTADPCRGYVQRKDDNGNLICGT